MKNKRQKLSGAERQKLLRGDLRGVSHAELGRKFRITRERVRQICKEVGHIKRRIKAKEEKVKLQEKAIQAKLSKKAKKLLPSKRIIKLSKLIREKKNLDLVAKKIGLKVETLRSSISGRYRKKWPELFPYLRRGY